LQQAVPVTLHVYNVGKMADVEVLNTVLRQLGTGAYHCGVEVYGLEWSFRDTGPSHRDPAVFSCKPMKCSGHNYSESVRMGWLKMTESEVVRLIKQLRKTWTGHTYDLLRCNCCHFCDEFCKRLGMGGIPTWTNSLASYGAGLSATGTYITSGGKALIDAALDPTKVVAKAMGGCCCEKGQQEGDEDTIVVTMPLGQTVLPASSYSHTHQFQHAVAHPSWTAPDDDDRVTAPYFSSPPAKHPTWIIGEPMPWA
jgi:hypothetical protein